MTIAVEYALSENSSMVRADSLEYINKITDIIDMAQPIVGWMERAFAEIDAVKIRMKTLLEKHYSPNSFYEAA
ncbi:hypothetical protein SYK_05110 [Pseudodesulfovibrio nedwellii]|uniref:Uncharacterized protein n=2 Tax=Pseudodesulfovibrio nedwellii TaxID=2973072 RepID=A0ABM8AXD9_9BACT|nr:hypothetical protein SYK_05110 [Pseudodesulfovibrio nedwellii]